MHKNLSVVLCALKVDLVEEHARHTEVVKLHDLVMWIKDTVAIAELEEVVFDVLIVMHLGQVVADYPATPILHELELHSPPLKVCFDIN